MLNAGQMGEGEVRNNVVIFFLAWLVAMDYFEESSFFCTIKGHTYSRIDQSYRALIGQLLTRPIWTVSMMLHYIFKYLRAYNCLGLYEMHHLWDWVEFFKPHVRERFAGFGTGQYSSQACMKISRDRTEMAR